jgi:hypothetical protein
MLPDVVTVRRKLAPRRGKAGGERMDFTPWSGPIACAIHPVLTDTADFAMQPDLRETWQVFFGSDLGLDDEDQVMPAGGTRPLVVTGPMRWADNLYVVVAEGRR